MAEPTEEPVDEPSDEDEELFGSHTLAAVVDEINKIDEARMRHEANPNGHPHELDGPTGEASRVPEAGLIAQIATRVERWDGQVAAHRVETRAVKVGLASLKDHVDARFDKVDKRFEGVDERFVGIDGRFDGLDSDVQLVLDHFGIQRPADRG